MKKRVETLLSGVSTSSTTGDVVDFSVCEPNISFQAWRTGASATTANLFIYASNDGSNWLQIAEMTLPLADPVTGFVAVGAWRYYKAVTGTVPNFCSVSANICG